MLQHAPTSIVQKCVSSRLDVRSLIIIKTPNIPIYAILMATIVVDTSMLVVDATIKGIRDCSKFILGQTYFRGGWENVKIL